MPSRNLKSAMLLVSRKELRPTKATLCRTMKMTRMVREQALQVATGAASDADSKAAASDTAAPNPEEASAAAKAAQA